MVSTHLKNMRENGNLLHFWGENEKSLSCHHLEQSQKDHVLVGLGYRWDMFADRKFTSTFHLQGSPCWMAFSLELLVYHKNQLRQQKKVGLGNTTVDGSEIRQSTHLGWCYKTPCKSWDKLITSTGEFTGFLVAINSTTHFNTDYLTYRRIGISNFSKFL